MKMVEINKNNPIDELMSDENVSDESVYAIHRFLENLILEFESKAFTRLRQHCQE